MKTKVYATCEDCGQEMIQGIECSRKKIKILGKEFKRVPHRNDDNHPSRTCGDCGVSVGGIHHNGCDMERCPCCGHQLISCACTAADAAEPLLQFAIEYLWAEHGMIHPDHEASCLSKQELGAKAYAAIVGYTGKKPELKAKKKGGPDQNVEVQEGWEH